MPREYKLERINARVEHYVVTALENEAVRRSNQDGITWTISSVVRRVLADWAVQQRRVTVTVAPEAVHDEGDYE